MTPEERIDVAIYKAALEANAKLQAELERYKEASFRDAIEFGKFQTMLQVAQDRITQAILAERERCARIAESFDAHQGWGDVDSIAAAIRSEENA